MRVQDFFGKTQIDSSQGIDEVLSRRDPSFCANEYYLFPNDKNDPHLYALVRGENVYLVFLNSITSECFVSLSPTVQDDLDATSIFYESIGGLETDVQVRYVIPARLFVAAVKEFFNSERLPSCVQWESL
jgi:Immunity protein Imm1